ncbi:Transcriptional regulatory protein ZraR [Geodia barretti]|uniref:Transcriptional regulatory protein ZraR n=1 Tax=Geodia barretti TaxID=519541 RepID=A0AA35RYX4_GEOBA|nr:Transcriptional regulatory protein ZraR [Geodia barretti]
MASILIVDDDQAQLTILQRILKREGYTVEIVEDSKAALENLEKQMFDLVISDMWMSSRFEGRDLLREIKRTDPDLPVLIMTAYAELNDAVNLVAHEGAFYYLEKPIQTRGALGEPEAVNDDSTPEIQIDEIIGESEQMQELFKKMARILHRGVTQVLITGETGSGKSLVARALHKNGLRKDKPFIAVNCGAIPDTLIESELFGHEKGAFTDAAQQKKGLFEVANEGILFLDEIGDLPIQTQSKLLHVLEERNIRRVGGTQSIKVDVCVIAATNKDLIQAVRDGAFRDDLYFRLNVIPLHVPPLREHPEDIPMLVNYLIDKFSNEYAEALPKQVTPQAMSALRRYEWPGNIRQLENYLRRIFVLSENEVIDKDELPPEILDTSLPTTDVEFDIPEEGVSLEEIIKEYVYSALARSNGNQIQAAKLLGISRRKLQHRMQKYELQSQDFKTEL